MQTLAVADRGHRTKDGSTLVSEETTAFFRRKLDKDEVATANMQQPLLRTYNGAGHPVKDSCL